MRTRRMSYIFVIFSICVLVTFLIIVGQIFSNRWIQKTPTPNERTINLIEVYLDTDFQQVASINITDANDTLSKQNFSFHPRSEIAYPDPFIQYSIGDKQRNYGGGMFIGIYTNNTSKSAWLRTSDSAVALTLEGEKDYIIKRTNQVAQACNITLNWDIAKWTVSYSD